MKCDMWGDMSNVETVLLQCAFTATTCGILSYKAMVLKVASDNPQQAFM